MNLIDIGANLANERFEEDIEAVLIRAWEAKVSRIVITGTSLSASRKAAKLAGMSERLYFTAGLHPHCAKEYDQAAENGLRQLLMDKKAIGVGETGLDYFRDLSPRLVQQKAMQSQVALGVELKKPLFLHERDAAEDFRALLKEFSTSLPRSVVHCFTGSKDEATKYLDMGLYIGVTGWLGQSKRNAALVEAVRHIPLDRLMIETDAPYLAAPAYRPPVRGRNEPASLVEVARLVASIKGMALDEVCRLIQTTTCEFWGWPEQA